MNKSISLPKLKNKAQEIFNKWIRKRDEGQLCISCGKPGNQAGHYLSVKQFGACRYLPENCALQCSYCNLFCHGNQAMFRIGLVKRIGEKRVKDLEKYAIANRVKRWTREELINIINKYKNEG